MNEIIKKYVSRIRSPKVLITVGLIGIALIFISSLGTNEKRIQNKESDEFSAEEYCNELEQEIEKLVNEITGSKSGSVMITLDSGVRYSYADTREENSTEKNENEEISSQEQLKSGYITVKNADGSEQALLVTAEMPSIRGVAIVCNGGDNEIIRQKIENAVTAALNITSKRVYICGRKN